VRAVVFGMPACNIFHGVGSTASSSLRSPPNPMYTPIDKNSGK
jgi:hypothetical protein